MCIGIHPNINTYINIRLKFMLKPKVHNSLIYSIFIEHLLSAALLQA